MLFNTLQFAVFFSISFLIYCLLQNAGQGRKLQNWLLIGASLYFYGSWNVHYIWLLIASSVLNYAIGAAIHTVSAPAKRRTLLTLGVVFNLGLLAVFKYAHFAEVIVQDVTGQMGWPAPVRLPPILLPVGISFFTFQAIGYIVDVYRNDTRRASTFSDFLLFKAFFPQLVAGPIERSHHLLLQIESPRHIRWAGLVDGAWLILLGLFQKSFVADNLAALVNPIFANPSSVSGAQILIATYGFAFQIYGDFSGYSNMARGMAKWMGFDLMLNFNCPYFAVNPSDFWHRWHISLSTWLRDYLYIPLGGSRGSAFATYRNLMLTMALGGFWHGAAWNFIYWGIYHGLLLCGHRLAVGTVERKQVCRTPGLLNLMMTAGLMFLMFHATCFGWLLFRANSVDHLELLLSRLYGVLEFRTGVGWGMLIPIAQYACPVLLLDSLQYLSRDEFAVFRLPVVVRGFLYAAMILALLVMGRFEADEFIYFQF